MFVYIFIYIKGLKQLNICEENGINVMVSKENETDNEKQDRQLLLGLKKIRNIANLENKEQMLDQLRRIRGRFNRDIFRSYVHYVLNYLIPNNVWNISRSENRIGQMFTIHDEAFVILVMMNNWKVWECMAKGERRGKGKQFETLFTNQKQKIGDIEVRMKGWSNEGMREFNKTLRYLISVRNMYEWITIENDLMTEYKKIDGDKSCKKRKRDNNDEILLMDRETPLDAYCLNFVQI